MGFCHRKVDIFIGFDQRDLHRPPAVDAVSRDAHLLHHGSARKDKIRSGFLFLCGYAHGQIFMNLFDGYSLRHK